MAEQDARTRVCADCESLRKRLDELKEEIHDLQDSANLCAAVLRSRIRADFEPI